MLTLVAPSSMTVDQQTLWLASAVDSLEDIRAEEVQHISAEVRRSVTRHNQIIPMIAEKVAERRAAIQRERDLRARLDAFPPLPPEQPKRPQPRLSAGEIAAMPKWLRDMGVRVGFLERRDGKLVDVA